MQYRPALGTDCKIRATRVRRGGKGTECNIETGQFRFVFALFLQFLQYVQFARLCTALITPGTHGIYLRPWIKRAEQKKKVTNKRDTFEAKQNVQD